MNQIVVALAPCIGIEALPGARRNGDAAIRDGKKKYTNNRPAGRSGREAGLPSN